MNWSLGVAIGAALAASACCTIPLALVSLGVSGVWIGSLTALEPYRWLFVLFAMSALGYAGYNEWQMSRRPECDCETVFSSTTRRSLVGAGALAVVVLIVSPWLVAPSPSEATQQTRVAATATEEAEASPPASFRQIVLVVEDMTCSACPATVRKALEDIEAVYNVEATYEPPEAVVRFDPENTSVEALTQATKRAGFPSHPKSAAETP
jgi:mercuric transport protein